MAEGDYPISMVDGDFPIFILRRASNDLVKDLAL